MRFPDGRRLYTSVLFYAKHGRNDHREDAPHFIKTGFPNDACEIALSNILEYPFDHTRVKGEIVQGKI